MQYKKGHEKSSFTEALWILPLLITNSFFKFCCVPVTHSILRLWSLLFWMLLVIISEKVLKKIKPVLTFVESFQLTLLPQRNAPCENNRPLFIVNMVLSLFYAVVLTSLVVAINFFPGACLPDLDVKANHELISIPCNPLTSMGLGKNVSILNGLFGGIIASGAVSLFISYFQFWRQGETCDFVITMNFLIDNQQILN